jgi:lipopolysaccharide export system protein LptC
MLNRRFILFALLLAAIALWINFQQIRQESTTEEVAIKHSDYSWQLFDSTTWQVDKTDSQHSRVMQAKTLFYQESLRKSELSEPLMLISQPQQTITARSQSGQTLNDSQIELSGQVVLQQYEQAYSKLTPDTRNNTLTSEHILYNADTQQASTPEPVVIRHASGITRGTGLQADLSQKQFRLQSDVSGTYLPTNAPTQTVE